MAQTAEPIHGALAAYRAHIADVNRRAMEVIIPQIEAADMGDPELWESPEQEEEARLDFMHMLLGSPTEPPIERPSDVLNNWDLIVQQVALDGGKVDRNTERRATERAAYRSAILEGLSRLECPSGQWSLPSDFEALMQEIDSLEGPGWYRLRDQGGLVFWEGWGARTGLRETPEEIKERVQDGQSILKLTVGLDEDYDVAGGWELGSGNESICFAMYSRLKDDDTQVWSWRYVASLGQFGTEVFDDLVGVLDWYKSYNEPDEQDCEISPEEVFQP